MDFNFKKQVPNPREKAGPFSILFYHWTLPLFRKGAKSDLESDDLYDHLKEDSAEALGDRLELEWEHMRLFQLKNGVKRNENAVPRLIKVLASIHWKTYLPYGLLNLLNEAIISTASPILLRLFTKSFLDSTITRQEQYIYGFAICIVALTDIFILHCCNFELFHLGMKCKLELSSLIYRKVLRLSQVNKGETSFGQLSSFIANDANRFSIVLLEITNIISAPIQITLITYLLWQEFGISCIPGVIFILLLTVFQYFTGKYSAHFRRDLSARTDERARVMNEIIMAMRVIKMYAWEKTFAVVVDKLRKYEIDALKRRSYLRASFFGVFRLSGTLTLFLILLCFILSGNELVADKVFFAATISNLMIRLMALTLPSVIFGLGELFVSINRIEDLLDLDDTDQDQGQGHGTFLKYDNGHIGQIESIKDLGENMAALEMENLHGSWTLDKSTLENINLTYKGNGLIMIVGSVGAGKTSFLNTILGELPIRQGKAIVNGQISYASQEAWIFSGTIRQNILFGQQLDQSRYEEVLNCCCLGEDLKQWRDGDLTIVGERGVLLSGGQKARVGLARAIYRRADIYLLDDPLSAVDINVGRKIMERCILGHLKKSLTFLVTHQLQYMPHADSIVVLHNGELIAQGNYLELIRQNIDIGSLITETDADKPLDKHYNKETDQMNIIEDCKLTSNGKSKEIEQMATGAVTWKTYLNYFRAGDSLCGLLTVWIGFPIVQAMIGFSSYWLSVWTNYVTQESETKTKSDSEFQMQQLNVSENLNPNPNVDSGGYVDHEIFLIVYIVLILIICFGILTVIINLFRYSLKIGVNLHNRMFSSIIRAPISFFNEQPSGRIMNRFTKDLSSMDEELPICFLDTIWTILETLYAMLIVIYANSYMVFPTVVIIIVFYRFRCYYIKTARSLKRLDATTKSPLFTHLNATIQGLTTIRASKCQKVLIRQFDAYQDINTSALYMRLATTRWFAIWLELCCVMYLIFAVLGFLFLSTSVLGGNVGLTLSTILLLMGYFQWGMRQSAETENMMTSVERILEYASSPPEAELETKPELKLQDNWPDEGHIRFESVSLAYNGMNVLEKLTFEIKSKEKLGIVGRTGAGKSSIIEALLRMVETDGNIYIDGISIKDVGLHDLRNSISVIPQDPVLFSGTVRYNLDPFDHYKDSELWQVLDEVELKESIYSLDFQIADGGNNFSVGQKQLICLARAILRKNKIIVMDEATANVDLRTDNLIQKTIRKIFSQCTILTIAHRLDTVLDSDRILVLDKGSIVEYGCPADLLKMPNEQISGMDKS